jgi:replicative DNA helicase
MSDGLKLIALISENGSASLFRDIPQDLFVEDEARVYTYVRRHYRRYGTLPTIRTIEEELDVELPEADESPEFYVKKLYDRRMYSAVRQQYAELQRCLREFDMDRARDVIASMQSLTRVLHSDNDVRTLREASRAVIERYEFAHRNPGVTGVPTLWSRYDQLTGGYSGGDLITYVARPEVGKTFTMLRHAAGAYISGASVLVVTTEMTIDQIARRYLSLLTGIDPNFIKRGELSNSARRRLEQYVAHIDGADRFHLYSGGMKRRVSDVDVLVQELRPDILFIDGIYLMLCDNRNVRTKADRVSEVFDEAKQLAIARNLPVVATTQFNRVAGRKGKEGSLENIAYSDAISTHSSIIVSLQEGLAGRERDTRCAEFIKGREGESGKVYYSYQFRPVNLDELAEDEEGAGDSAEADLDWVA